MLHKWAASRHTWNDFSKLMEGSESICTLIFLFRQVSHFPCFTICGQSNAFSYRNLSVRSARRLILPSMAERVCNIRGPASPANTDINRDRDRDIHLRRHTTSLRSHGEKRHRRGSEFNLMITSNSKRSNRVCSLVVARD